MHSFGTYPNEEQLSTVEAKLCSLYQTLLLAYISVSGHATPTSQTPIRITISVSIPKEEIEWGDPVATLTAIRI